MRFLGAILALLLALGSPSQAFVRGGASSTTVSLAPYAGSVGNHTGIPTGADGINLQFNSRSGHYMRGTPAGLATGFANFFMQDNALLPGALVRAALEYPAGHCTLFTWSGNPTLTVSQVITASDYLPSPPPNGAQFWIRYFVDGTASFGYPLNREYTKNTLVGDAFEPGVSGLTDRTDCLSDVPDTAPPSDNFQPPFLIGVITTPSVCMIGDSIAFGNNDAPDISGDVGYGARTFGATVGYTNSAVPGDQANLYLANHTYRAQLSVYCSHIFLQYGTNDFFLGHSSAAQLDSDLAGIRAIFPGKIFIQPTISPNTREPPPNLDGWLTLAGQTILDATDNASRITYNGMLRAGIAGVSHYAEAADVDESSRNSGLWCVDNVTVKLCTSDGIHPSPLIYQSLKSTIDLTWLTH